MYATKFIAAKVLLSCISQRILVNWSNSNILDAISELILDWMECGDGRETVMNTLDSILDSVGYGDESKGVEKLQI